MTGASRRRRVSMCNLRVIYMCGAASRRRRVRLQRCSLLLSIEWRRADGVCACDRCWCQLNFTPYSCISNSFIRVELRELKLA